MKKKILIVDDSSTALMMTKLLLQKEPYEIVTARDGAEGVLRAHAERPDLVLLDVVMPKMTGFEACRALRASEQTKSLPILLVTTRGEEDNVETGYAAGCTDYVTKPVNATELLTKVRAYIG